MQAQAAGCAIPAAYACAGICMARGWAICAACGAAGADAAVPCWGSQGWSNVGCAAHSSPAAPLLLLFEGADIRAMGARQPFAAVAGGLASADTNPRRVHRRTV